MQIGLTRSAEQDLLDGFWFYESQQEGLGTYFIDSLVAEIDSLIGLWRHSSQAVWPIPSFAGQTIPVRGLLRI